MPPFSALGEKRKSWRKPPPWLALLVVAMAVVADAALAPRLLGGWTGVRFGCAAVALVGVARGRGWGVLAGWMAGALTAALCNEYLGMAMLRLGLLGFAGGFLCSVAELGVSWMDAGVLLALLAGEDIFSALLAWATVGTFPELELLGVTLTTLLLWPLLPHFLHRKQEGFVPRRPASPLRP